MNIFKRLFKRKPQLSIDDLFNMELLPGSEEDKKKLVDQGVMTAAKVLGSLTHLLKLKSHIEATITFDEKEYWQLEWKKVYPKPEETNEQ